MSEDQTVYETDEEQPQPAPCDCEKPKRARKPAKAADIEPSTDIEAEPLAPVLSYQPPRHKRRCGCR